MDRSLTTSFCWIFSVDAHNKILRHFLVVHLTGADLLNTLIENGGQYSYTDSWAIRFYERHNIVPRVATTKRRDTFISGTPCMYFLVKLFVLSFRVRSLKTRKSNAAFSIPVFSTDAADSGIQCFQLSNTKRKTKKPQKMQPNFIPKKVK